MKLNTWAEHQFRDVDQDGTRAVRVRLISAEGNTTWHTWELEELSDPSAWADEADAYLKELTDELPPKGIQFLFVAETKTGDERAVFPRTVKGRNRSASDAVLRGEPQAVAQAMDATARTMQRILESANVQIEVLTKTVRDQAEQTHGLLEFIRELNTQQALSAQENKDAMTHLLAGANEYIPTIINLLAERVLSPKPTGPKTVGKVASIVGKEK